MNPLIDQLRSDVYLIKCQIQFYEKMLISKGLFSKADLDLKFKDFMRDVIGMPDASGKLAGNVKINFYSAEVSK